MGTALLWTIGACLLGQTGPAALVGLGDEGAAAVAVARAGACGEMGPLLPRDAILERLAGAGEVNAPRLDVLKRMLIDARDREARFDTAGANALREEILRALDQAVRPSEEVRGVAAAAAHDLAAALLADGDEAAALDKAEQALAHFSGRPVDTARHAAPVLALFRRAAERLAQRSAATLEVAARVPGRLYIDGSAARATDGGSRLSLPVGRHRVWLVADNGVWSLPHVVDLPAAGARVEIDPELDGRLRLDPLSLRCSADCAAELARLGHRLGVGRVLAVRADGSELALLDVDVATGESHQASCSTRLLETPLTEPGLATFRPTYLLPLGIGQLSQRRPVFATAYGVAQLGLIAWHVTALVQHRTALEQRSASEPRLRKLRNISAGLTYGVVGASIIEAVVYGLVFGE